MTSGHTKNLLYIGTPIGLTPIGGREQLSQLIRDSLQGVAEGGLKFIELPRIRITGRKTLSAILYGYVDGVSPSTIGRVIATVNSKSIGRVLLDGSNLGALAKAISRACPQVQVSTFFHNCEARFFWGSFRQERTLRSLGILMANYLAERQAVRFSDKRICLSERDSDLLQHLYGYGATHISAMALRDKLPEVGLAPSTPPTEKYALFVGGAFYANQAGITWYCKNVASHIPLHTYVAGKGLSTIKKILERNPNVTVIGEVDDLAPWYQNAHVVVAPIFDGSGMKTKVAEALMFGKRIVGTEEAFSGYEDVAGMAGEVCVDAEGFVNALKREAERQFSGLDPQLRAIYEDRYSFRAALSRLSQILSSTP